MIRVLADQNLYKIRDFIPAQTELETYNPESGLPSAEGFDALLVRTVTQLNHNTFPDIPGSLKFLGTGSSGSDHIDEDYFEGKPVTLYDAKGCNARAVAEYVATALLLWKEKNGKDIETVGVIGVGHAGSAVIELLESIGVQSKGYDPPRAEREPGFKSVSLDEVLDCDVLTFHVPLNKKGDHPTFHWLDESKLGSRNYKLIINAARGGVVDELALMKAYIKESVGDYILDVWEEEPDFNPEIAKYAFIATPHIAGYSEQAKLNATRMICESMAKHFNMNGSSVDYEYVPKNLDLAHIEYGLKDLLTRLHPIMEYDRALRDLIDRPDKKVLFRMLRNDHPYRFEYPYLKIRKEILEQYEVLTKLGINPKK